MPASRGLQDLPGTAGKNRTPVGHRSSARSGLRIQSYGTPLYSSPAHAVADSTPNSNNNPTDQDLISPFARRLRIASGTPSQRPSDPFLATGEAKRRTNTYALTPPPSSPSLGVKTPVDSSIHVTPSLDRGVRVGSGW